MLFTEDTIPAIPARLYSYFLIEEGSKGFAIKVHPTGVHSFYYRKKVDKKRVDIPLGSELNAARQLYRTMLGQGQEQEAGLNAHPLAIGAGPAQGASRSASFNPLYYRGASFGGLMRRFIAEHVGPHLRPATAKYYVFCLEKVAKDLAGSPALTGNVQVDTARKEFKAYIHSVGQSTPTLANRIRETLSSCFKWGIYEDLCYASPVFGIRVFKEKPRARRFAQGELPAFFRVLNDGSYDPGTANCLRLILATGLRASEALHIRPVDIDLDKGTLLIPTTKNGDPFLVPLVPLTAGILQDSINGKQPTARLFRTSIFGLRQVAKRAAKRAGVTDCSTHDLRRTFATLLGELGVSIPVIGRCLNHSAGGGVTTRVYALYDMLDEKRDALLKASERLVELGVNQRVPPLVSALAG